MTNQEPNNKLKFIFLILTISIFVSGIIFGAPIFTFIDVPSIIIVFLPTIFITIGKFGFSTSWLNDNVLECIGKTALYSGIIGFLIGFIFMMKNLHDPSKIGPSMAICLLSLFYSAIIYLLSFALKTNSKNIPSDIKVIPFLYSLCCITCFKVLLSVF
jgi:flagellar motor component MotA